MRLRCFMMVLSAITMGPVALADVTFESLLSEMTDLEALTRFPDPAYTCKQFSSYDRRSTDPNVLTDENWFANGDRGQHLRTEQRNGADEWVMMDAGGPGAIVRIWSANPDGAGIVRVYLDGTTDPVIEMSLQDMVGGADMPFLKPIACETSKGWNSYLPIPYAKHCKVTSSKPDFYYHINYRTYGPGTPVQSYTPALAEQNEARIRQTAKVLAAPDQVALPSGAETLPLEAKLGPGEAFTSAVDRAGAIYSLRVKVDAENVEAALRGCLLEVMFDGQAAPSVQTPFGDFFGTAPGLNKYRSLPSGVLDDGTMYAHWVMPIAKSAEVRVTNHTERPVSLEGQMGVAAYTWSDRSMYFHAKWRAEYPIPTRPRQDWTYVACKGKGVFVGDMLHVTNPVKDWWGEGDEKIYVDGESFPSHFGTGSEDYYGYAWCCPEVFTHAYHNQPRCDGPGNYGQTCVSRFHILDDIPFTTSFKFDIEVWHWADCEIAMAATSYWYAAAGSTDSFQPPRAEELQVIAAPPPPVPKKVSGAIEGESLKVVSCSGGKTQTQDGPAEWGWSGGKQLWWTGAKPGDAIEISFPAKKAGSSEVYAVLTRAVDYGIVQLSVNGKPPGQPIDLFNSAVAPTDEMPLGVFELRLGTNNTLKATILDKNPQAAPGYMFGLDYLLLKPAK